MNKPKLDLQSHQALMRVKTKMEEDYSPMYRVDFCATKDGSVVIDLETRSLDGDVDYFSGAGDYDLRFKDIVLRSLDGDPTKDLILTPGCNLGAVLYEYLHKYRFDQLLVDALEQDAYNERN